MVACTRDVDAQSAPAVAVSVDENARRFRAVFSGLQEVGENLNFRFDLSDSRCKDPARVTAGGTHIDRVIYEGQIAERNGTLSRNELIGLDCPRHVRHTLTVRLWGGGISAQASTPFCLGGCENPTATAILPPFVDD